MYTFISIEVQFTRLVSIRPFVTLVVIFTNNMVGAPSLLQPALYKFMYYVKNIFLYSIFMYLYLNLYSSYHLIRIGN